MSKPDYIEFQDRSQPLGYLITIRTHGTWLHYDERGSMDRKHHHHYGAPKLKPNRAFEQQERSWLKHPPVTFSREQRLAVEEAIRKVCVERGYELHAVNARTNHVHTVVSASVKPELVMNAFKAYATRKLREMRLLPPEVKPWSRHGSNPYLWTEDELARAVDYVVNGQDGVPYESWVVKSE